MKTMVSLRGPWIEASSARTTSRAVVTVSGWSSHSVSEDSSGDARVSCDGGSFST